MSDSIETKGKTVDLAVSEALLQLGLRRDEVEIKVLEEPRAGLMGFIGARQAKVLVTKRVSRGGRFGGRGHRRDDDHRAHDLTAAGASGRGRGGRGGRDGARDGARDENRGGRSEGRGGRDDGRGNREGNRDRSEAPRGGERGGRGGGRDGGRDAGRDSARDGNREPRRDGGREGGREGGRDGGRDDRGGRGRRDEFNAAPRDLAARPARAEGEGPGAAEGNREDRPDGQRSRRRRGGRGRGGRGRSGQGAPRDDQQPNVESSADANVQPNGNVAFDAPDDDFAVREAAPASGREDRGERGGRGRGGRGGRGRGSRGGERSEAGERPVREFGDDVEQPVFASDDEFVVNEAPVREASVPRERAREERSRRDLHPAAESTPSAVEAAAPEVIETAVIANVAPRAKPKAWGGLGARRPKASAPAGLPRVEQESPATAGAVFKPARTKATRAAAERASAREAAGTAKIGEIDSPLAGPGGTTGYGSPRSGGYGTSPRGAADEVIAAGIAATDYAKPLAAVDEAGQPTLLAELANGMLARAGFPCECETIPGEYHAVKVAVDEDSAGMLIGRGGSTAEAIEHLVERMASNAAGDRVRMNLDINDYRIRREDQLRERAAEAIADVRATGEPYHMESMDARERRVVHLYAEELPDINTYTVMSGGGKHVVIALNDGADGRDDDGAEGGED